MLNEVFRMAVRFGMSKGEYFHSTPGDIDLFIEEKTKKIHDEAKRENDLLDYQAWLHGVYVARAVSSVLNGKKSKYPTQPLSVKDKNRIVCTEDMPEEEKYSATMQLFANLEEMQKSFEMNNKKEEDGN